MFLYFDTCSLFYRNFLYYQSGDCNYNRSYHRKRKNIYLVFSRNIFVKTLYD